MTVKRWNFQLKYAKLRVVVLPDRRFLSFKRATLNILDFKKCA